MAVLSPHQYKKSRNEWQHVVQAWLDGWIERDGYSMTEADEPLTGMNLPLQLLQG